MEAMVDRIQGMLKVLQSLAPRRMGTLPLLALWAACLLAGCGQKGPLMAAKATGTAAAAAPAPSASLPAR